MHLLDRIINCTRCAVYTSKFCTQFFSPELRGKDKEGQFVLHARRLHEQKLNPLNKSAERDGHCVHLSLQRVSKNYEQVLFRRQRQTCFSSKTSRLALGPTRPSTQSVPGSLQGAKRLERNLDHSPPPCAEVRNDWSRNCAPTIRLRGSGTETLSFFTYIYGSYLSRVVEADHKRRQCIFLRCVIPVVC